MSGKRRSSFDEFFVGLSVLVAAVWVVVLIVWVSIDRMEIVDASDREARETLVEIDGVAKALLSQETSLRAYVAAPHPQFLQDYQDGRQRLTGALSRLAAMDPGDVEEQSRVKVIAALSKTWIDSVASPEIALVQRGRAAEARAMVKAQSGERQMRRMHAALEQLRGAEQDVVTVRARDQAQAFVTGRWTLVLGAFCALVLAELINGRSLWLLVRSRDAAEAADRSKTEFLANMSHELRTPMNGVVGVAELLAQEPLTARQAELVAIIRSSGSTLDRLLADLLDVTRLEEGTPLINPAPFNLAGAARQVAALLEPRAADKGLGFVAEISPLTDTMVVGDEARIRQILTNLLSNAIKFTLAGRVALSVRLEHDVAWITVTDTGIGFDPADRARLFARFEQADGSITRRFGGAGLGLSISRDLAEQMGGAITAEPRPGGGSVFTLTLPLAAAPAEHLPQPQAVETEADAQPEAEAEDEADGDAARVLVVDDNPTNQRVLSLMLDGAGIRTCLADNGQEALDRWGEEAFDAILMDIQMPVMDGLTAVRRIRATEAETGRSRTPILMVSANALPEHVAASRAAGADGHLAKPVTVERLFAALERLGAPADDVAETVAA